MVGSPVRFFAVDQKSTRALSALQPQKTLTFKPRPDNLTPAAFSFALAGPLRARQPLGARRMQSFKVVVVKAEVPLIMGRERELPEFQGLPVVAFAEFGGSHHSNQGVHLWAITPAERQEIAAKLRKMAETLDPVKKPLDAPQLAG